VSRSTRSVFPPSNLRIVFSEGGLVPLVTIWRRLRQGIFDSYRPELHYMRGPGPKWREKHAHVTSVWPVSRHR
jgi:hypothetical protein